MKNLLQSQHEMKARQLAARERHRIIVECLSRGTVHRKLWKVCRESGMSRDWFERAMLQLSFGPVVAEVLRDQAALRRLREHKDFFGNRIY